MFIYVGTISNVGFEVITGFFKTALPEWYNQSDWFWKIKLSNNRTEYGSE